MLHRRQFAQLALGVSALAQPNRRKPNIIILFADDMGYGDLGCYGHPDLRTPNLDRLAEEGARFTSYYAAASVCTPSRVGLLTGRYPMRAKQPNNFGPDSKTGLQLSEILLPQLLKQQGYRTMAIGKWHLGHSPVAHLPTHRGFDQYLGLLYSNDMIPPWVKTERPLQLFKNDDAIEHVTDQSRLTERYTNEAVRFIRESGNNPFFLYVPYAMPHLPLAASARTKGKSAAGFYGDVIEELDWSAGEILRTLKEQRIDNDTLVIFTSDNGPWNDLPPRMLQQGNEWWHTGSKSLLRGSKGSTFEGGFRVPALARWPGRIPARQTIRGMAAALDWFPTLASLAGAALPKDRVYDGADLMPVLTGQAAEPPRQEFFFFLGDTLEAVRQGPWKYRVSRRDGVDFPTQPQATAALYHLGYDPAERYNVIDRHRDIADRLAARMQAMARELEAKLA